VAKIDAAVVAAVPTTSYEGDGFRQQAPEFDPLSGEGARRRGGRFNPPDSFSVLYLCSTRACAVAEFYRAGNRLAIGPEGLLPRHLYRYDLRFDQILDLTRPENLEHLGISQSELVGEDLSVTRSVGEGAHSLGLQAIRSPSAAGRDHVLALLIENIGSGVINPALAEVWSAVSDVDETDME
jgi:RES domain-containing protein